MKKTPQRIGRCQPCHGRSDCQCCKQIKNTDSFKSDITNKTFKIFHEANCRSGNLIYLMECTLCSKNQYVGKCERSLNRRDNTHRNDVWRTDGPPCDKHFQKENHDFNKHLKIKVQQNLP